jgi:four helix bundle protein
MPLILASAEQIHWERSCPRILAADAIWKLDVYRTSLFLVHVVREDLRAVGAGPPANGIAEQLLRSAGSVSANIAEGFSRSTRVDRLRFFAYALGSARECVTWYESIRGTISDDAIDDRLLLLTRIRALLLGFIRAQRTQGRQGGVLEG